jgi:hypothetical protein
MQGLFKKSNEPEIAEAMKFQFADKSYHTIKKGDKLKLSDAAKKEYMISKPHMKKFLNDTFTFDSMAGGALRVIASDGDSFIMDASRFIVSESEEMNEGREQIKRKYAEYNSIRVNETAPIRNEIIRFVGKRFVTEEEMKSFLTKLSEDRGKDFDGRQWFARNGRYFEKFENRGQEVWTLSKFGKRVLEFLRRSEQSKNIINESIGLFKNINPVDENI